MAGGRKRAIAQPVETETFERLDELPTGTRLLLAHRPPGNRDSGRSVGESLFEAVQVIAHDVELAHATQPAAGAANGRRDNVNLFGVRRGDERQHFPKPTSGDAGVVNALCVAFPDAGHMPEQFWHQARQDRAR